MAMDNHHKLLLGMYMAAIIIVLGAFFDNMLLAVTLLVILVISLMQKIVLYEYIDKQGRKTDGLVDFFIDRIGSISDSLEKIHQEIVKSFSDINLRMGETRRTLEMESETQYKDLSGRIVMLEQRLNDVKKNLGLAYDTLSERFEEKE